MTSQKTKFSTDEKFSQSCTIPHNRAQVRTFLHSSAHFRTIPHNSAHSAQKFGGRILCEILGLTGRNLAGRFAAAPAAAKQAAQQQQHKRRKQQPTMLSLFVAIDQQQQLGRCCRCC